MFHLFFLLGIFAATSTCQNLTLVLSSSSFPENVTYPDSIYDGGDSIYIFGGQQGYQQGKIYKYSISSDSLSFEGAVGYLENGGSLVKDSHGDIFYFLRRNVYRFLPGTLELLRQVATTPSDYTYASGVKFNTSSNQVQFVGTFSDYITCFDLSTLTSCPDGELTALVPSSTVIVSKGKAFIFKEPSYYLWPYLQRINTVELDTFKYSLGPLTFPVLNNTPSAVLVEMGQDEDDLIYLVGGNSKTASISTNGILQFEPKTFKTTFLPVQNFMITEEEVLMGASTVYVERLGRLYIFGGLTREIVDEYGVNKLFRNEIWYIDLFPGAKSG